MAALFVVALGLIAWQAPRTRPLQVPPFTSALRPGDQVFPVAVPPDAPLQLPSAPAARLAFLKEHAVEGFAPFPADACEGFIRMSAHHWLRTPVEGGSKGGHFLMHRTATGDPFAAGAPGADGPAPEVEVFCRP